MRARGFTLVEVMIVLAIAGLLAAIVLAGLQQHIEKSRQVQAILDLKEMSEKIRQLDKTGGALPATLADAGYGTRLDPWGRPYEYLNIRVSGTSNARKDKKLKPLNSDFDLYSVGPDGLTNKSLNNASSRDDVVRARDGGFIGTAEEFDP